MKCTATANGTGTQCRKYAIAGGTVCPTHGGSAPQVKAAAARRLRDLVDPSLNVLADCLEDKDPKIQLAAAREVLNRCSLNAFDEMPRMEQIDLWIRQLKDELGHE